MRFRASQSMTIGGEAEAAPVQYGGATESATRCAIRVSSPVVAVVPACGLAPSLPPPPFSGNGDRCEKRSELSRRESDALMPVALLAKGTTAGRQAGRLIIIIIIVHLSLSPSDASAVATTLLRAGSRAELERHGKVTRPRRK